MVPTGLEQFPSVLLHKHDGTGQFATHAMLSPGKSVRRFSSPARFKLVSIDNDSGAIVEPKTPLHHSRASFWSELRAWKHVAIFSERKGAFLSCHRQTSNIPGLGDVALADHRLEIGETERFELLLHHSDDDSQPVVSFRSTSHHNDGLYLSDNKALGGILFRAESRREGATVVSHRAWEITPLLGFSSTDQRIKFVGVIDASGTVVMKLEPMPGDEGPEEDDGEDGRDEDEDEASYDGRSFRDNPYLRHAGSSVLGDLRVNGLKRGESTHVRTDSGDCHYYARDKHGAVFMVVASKGFSRALAGECLNDLASVYGNFADDKPKRNGSERKLFEIAKKREERIENELRFLVWTYNEHNESFSNHPLRKSICDRMEEAIDGVLYCDLNAKNQRQRVKDLNAAAAEFRKTMRRLRAVRLSKWTVMGAVYGGVFGSAGVSILGMAIGGPPMAAFLGSQGAKIGAVVGGSGTGALVGGPGVDKTVAVCSSGPPMWKNYAPSSNFGMIELHC